MQPSAFTRSPQQSAAAAKGSTPAHCLASPSELRYEDASTSSTTRHKSGLLETAYSATAVAIVEVPKLVAPPPGTWLHSTYHNVTAMLGAGVLGLPYTFAALGWAGGLAALCGCLLVSFYTFTLLVHLHENGPNHRFSRYHDLCEHAWGKRRGAWALLIFQIPFIFGLAVTYTVTGGESLGSFLALVKSGGTDSSSDLVLSLPVLIGVFSFIEVVLAQLPSLDSLAWVSGVGAAMSIVYSVGASVLSLRSAEPRSEIDFTPGAGGGADCGPPIKQFMAICSSITTVFFAYGGHNIALEIQATLPFPPTTVEPMMQGVYSAFSLTFVCYALTASTGYYAFGSSAKANILQSAGSNPLWLLAGCHLGVMFHVLASYQVYSSPLLDLCNHALTQLSLRAAPARSFPASDLHAEAPSSEDVSSCKRGVEEPLLAQDEILNDEALPGPGQSSSSPSLSQASPGLLSRALHRLGPGRRRFLLTCAYVSSSCLLACAIPFFGSLMGLIGAIGAAPTNFVMPCLLWLKLRKPKPLVSVTWWACWLLAIVGSLVGVFGAMGAMYGILDAKGSFQ